MFGKIINANVWLSEKTTPHALFESRGFAIYDWVAKSLILNPAHKVIVDIGAGKNWHFGPAIKKDSGAILIGLDVDGEEMASNVLLDQRVVADACQAWPIGEGSVDLVLSRATVEHLPDNLGFLRSAYEALKPGGKIALVFAGKWSPPMILNRILPSMISKKLLHSLVPNAKGIQGFKAPYNLCTHSAFRSALRQVGFTIDYEFNSYYSSSYFQFFFPIHFLSILSDYFRSFLSIRNLASQCLFVATKPISEPRA